MPGCEICLCVQAYPGAKYACVCRLDPGLGTGTLLGTPPWNRGGAEALLEPPSNSSPHPKQHWPSVRTVGPTGRPGERCACGWCTLCMRRALRTARHGAASKHATMRARSSNACKWLTPDGRCSIVVHLCAASRPASVCRAAWPAYPLRGPARLSAA